MANVTLTVAVQQPCFALFRRNNRWEQVRVMKCTKVGRAPWPDSSITNAVQFPDGTETEVRNSLLRHDRRIKKFVPHPEARG